jgi:hypothetical protein
VARRDDREYREHLSEEQRSQRGCIAGRMQPDFHHGLLDGGLAEKRSDGRRGEPFRIDLAEDRDGFVRGGPPRLTRAADRYGRGP